MVESWSNFGEFLENLPDLVLKYIQERIDLLGLIILIVALFIILQIILRFTKRYLLKKVKTKKQISNITVFIDLLKYIFIIFFLVVVLIYLSNDLGNLGFIAGLLTIAIGWALQKPISGVVAWLIIITRRPFSVGDRVIITGITGDITNISLTHIFLDEVGGTIVGEEGSRRTVMIPTSIVFEQEVINYTEKDDYLLDEVRVTITYESNLAKAEGILKNAVNIILKELSGKFPRKVRIDPHTRLDFKDSGVEISVRFNTIATRRNEIQSDVRREIHRMITMSKDVEFAYPHTEVLMRKNIK